MIASTSSGQAAGDEHRAERVERLHARVTALLQQHGRKRDCGQADRDVDEEDPLPREGVGDDPAQQDARSGAEAADCAPNAERDVPLPALGEGGHQDRKGGRRDRGRAEPLDRPGADQRGVVPGETAQERADREQDEAGHEDPAPAEQVGCAAAKEQEASEDECVGGDHPLQVRLREAQIRLDRGKCDVHDRDVEHDHELDGAE